MAETKSELQVRERILFFWITAFRGGLVIVLGLSLLMIPEKTFKMLANFMGIFWLMTGIVSIRQESHKHRDNLSLVAGVIGVLTGITVITRSLIRQWFGEELFVALLGIVISLTGLLHVVGGFRIGKQAGHGQTRLSIVLGIFEFILGIVLLLGNGSSTSTEQQLIYLFAIGWAMSGGILLIGDAIRQRRAMAQENAKE